MSGHSKWSTIKRKKAKFDAARGKVFTKVIREITVAARDGGGDPGGNPRLRELIEKAKSVNMPQDNITRAIKKGTGEIEGAQYEAVRYEGYGPDGAAIIIESLTDNKNRTVSEVRLAFSKFGGKVAEAGAVGWMFEHKGVLVISAPGKNEDELLELFFDFDIEDMKEEEDHFSIICAPEDLEKIKHHATLSHLTIESAELEWVAKDPINVSEESEEKVYKLLEALEELDDVQNVYSNLT